MNPTASCSYTALLIALLLAAAGASAVTPTGAELAWKYHCLTCHGEDGRSNEQRYPNLAGLSSSYLQARLQYFRSKIEPGNQMNGQAAPLSDNDISTLADYYSSKPVIASPASTHPKLVAEKGCIACHGIDGVAIAPAYPNLRGQWQRYLRLQLLAYRSGTRENAIMNGFAAGLSDDDIRALAEHYGED